MLQISKFICPSKVLALLNKLSYKELMHKYPYPFAVPSWVFPNNAKENMVFLNNKVMEVELLCFEPSLPPVHDFPEVSFTWHLHLPSSVPVDFFEEKEKYAHLPSLHEENIKWNNPWLLAKNIEDIAFYASCCVHIFEHCKRINPWAAVAHLPPVQISHAEEKLVEFIKCWQSHLPLNTLALENVRDAAHQDYEQLLCLENYKDLLLCLDIAHAISFEQKSIINYNSLMNKVALVHWSAPYPSTNNITVDGEKFIGNKIGKSKIDGEKNIEETYKKKDMHLPLYHLKNEHTFCQQAMNKIPKNAMHVIEVFDWQGIEDSVDFLKNSAAHYTKKSKNTCHL